MRNIANFLLSTVTKLRLKKSRRRLSSHSSCPRFGGYSRLSRIEPLEERLALYASTTLIDNGPVDHRIDMVFLNDGFIESELSTYIDKVDTTVAGLFIAAPFDAYASYFNIHRVDVTSTESGIDQLHLDPPVYVDTALGGKVSPVPDRGNWLGADTPSVTAAAGDAPDWDLVELILNGSGRANASGPFSFLSISNTTEVYLHELGHSLGKLADEYVEFSGSFPGGEPTARNLTTLYTTKLEMIAAEEKWYRWLTPDHPEIGVEDFEGGGLYPEDVFRPSQNSIMRSSGVGSSFDVVGKEALIIEMYKQPDISTIDIATAPGEYHYGHEFFVLPMQPENHELSIQWYFNNALVPGANGYTFDTSVFPQEFGETYTVKVEVVDNTDMVRDDEARAEFMTDTMEWTLSPILKVTTEVDEDGTNDGALSLREALALAADDNLYPDSDQIVFSPSVTEVSLDNQLVIDSGVDAVGPGLDLLTINANGGSRAFYISNGVEATISGMTITGGNESHGGGIYVAGDLTVESALVVGNSASNFGGGIYVLDTGKLTLLESTIDDNHALYGGGIFGHFGQGARLNILNSTISNNTATGSGGGINFFGWTAGGTTTGIIANSTISGNSAPFSGGLRVRSATSQLAVLSSTIAHNSANSGAGIELIEGPVVALHNSISADNSSLGGIANNIAGSMYSLSSYNLIGLGGNGGLSSTNGNILLVPGQNAGLRALGYYGGTTQTHALHSTSPAIDHGSESLATGLTTDQRGDPRVFDTPNTNGAGGAIDIGAVEFSVPQIVNVIISSTVPNPYGTNPSYEFDGVVGSELQLQTVPVGGADQISIQFSKNVDITSADLELIALNEVVNEPTPVLVDLPSLSNNFTATWTFSALLPAAQYLLRLADSVLDYGGNELDGEWTNPTYFDLNQFNQFGPSQVTSQFPSGDRLAGGDFEFVFSNMHGDASRDLIIDPDDILLISPNFDNPGEYEWMDGDFSGDGAVNFDDMLLMSPLAAGADWRHLQILGDYDNDYDLDFDDVLAFGDLFSGEDSSADLNDDDEFTQADVDAFYELFGLGIDLDVVI